MVFNLHGRVIIIIIIIIIIISKMVKSLLNFWTVNWHHVECFKYLGRMLTNDGRCTCEIKSRIAMAKATFNRKKTLFTSKLDLNLRKKLVKWYIWSMAFVWC